jgi:uncharacterized protein with von Willebrand factor type A (vWA) domain
VSTPADSVSDLMLRLVVFVAGHLRARGFAVSSSEAIDAARGLALVNLASQSQVRSALRATLAKDAAAAAALDQLLDRLLPARRPAHRAPKTNGPSPVSGTPGGGDLARAIHGGDDARVAELADAAIDTFTGLPGVDAVGTRSVRHHTARVLRGIGQDGLLRQLLALRRDQAGGPRSETERRMEAAEAEAAVRALADMIEKMITERAKLLAHVPPTSEAFELADLPILTAAADELDELRRAVRPLARRIAARLGRRRKRGRGSLDMRRTIRASMSFGGVPLTPALHRRRPTRPDLAVLCDVSGSVAQFAPFTLALLHALSSEFRHVRSWVFIDGIVEVTDLLHDSRGMLDARTLLARQGLVRDDGRSDYAEALAAFRRRWPDAVTPRTTVLIVGDARSHHRRAAIAELTELKAAARHVFWFNPEPAAEWDEDDSLASAYRARVDAMHEVATMRQLGDAITALR